MIINTQQKIVILLCTMLLIETNQLFSASIKDSIKNMSNKKRTCFQLVSQIKDHHKCSTCCKGKRGKRGKTGSSGAPGVPGAQGATGDTGADGTGGILEYAYIYNQSKICVPLEFDISFDTNGPMSSGFTHTEQTPYIRVANTGIYAITFTVYATENSQFALAINGTPLDATNATQNLPNTVFNAGECNRQINGHAIVSLTANDVITVRNHTSKGAVQLKQDGKQTIINASIIIEQIG